MRLEQIESSEDSELDKLRFAFAHHADIEDAPPKVDLFRALVDYHFGPDCANHFIWNPWADKMAEALCQHDRLGLVGCANSGKCLSPETPVLFFDGQIRKASEVRVGDKLMGDDSTPRTVLHSNPGRSNMVRIVPVIGEPWECNDDHILTLKGKDGSVIDISVKAYLATTTTFKANFKLFCVGVDFPAQPIEFDPQIYGIWLGDGSTGKTHITSSDHEVEVNSLVTDYFTRNGYRVEKKIYSGKCPSYQILKSTRAAGGAVKNPFYDFVRESSLGTGGKKRILPRYLYNSRDVRLKLLAGIIDADGHAAGTYFEISCSYPELSSDIAYLARSLGFRVSVTKRKAKCGDKTYPTDRINIIGHLSEIPTLRKKCRPHTVKMRPDCMSFKVEHLGDGDWFGFTLDGNGRFLLGDFTVTHNTDMGAVWALINWDADPYNTLAMVTSTSLKDSKKRMWGRVERYFSGAVEMKKRGHLVSSIGMLRSRAPDGSIIPDDRGVALIASEKKKEKEAVGKLIGMKAPKILLVADELPELTEALTSAFDYNLSMNRLSQMVGIGNFNSIHDPLGDFVKPKMGYASITTDSEEWETENGYCLRFDGLKSPNFFTDDGKDHWPFIYNRKNLKTHKKAGETTIQFWRMCRSFPCPLGTDNCIYSDADFIGGGAHAYVTIPKDPIRVCSLDPAFTHGGDRCPAIVGTFGLYNGVQTLCVDSIVHLREDIGRKTEARDMQIAQQFKDLCLSEKVDPKNAALDASGAGMPFASIVHTIWSMDVMPVQFGGAASVRPVFAHDPRPASEMYGNRVSELWFVGREFIRAGQIKGLTDEIARQMKARQYITQKAITLRTLVEPKSDLKARLGFSPDEADAFFVMLELCRQRFGFSAQNSKVSFSNVRRLFFDRAVKGNELYNDLNSETDCVNVADN